MVNLADIGLGLCVQLGKGGEVSVFLQHSCAMVHCLHVRFEIDAVGSFCHKGVLLVADSVSVLPFQCVKTCVGFWTYRQNVINHNIFRQKGVDAVEPLLFVCCQILCRVEMCIKIGCMHTGVGAPRSGDANLFMQQIAENVFQTGLHAGTVGLDLPAEIVLSVICQMEEIAHQLSFFS